MKNIVKQPAPAIYRSKVHHIEKALDELSYIGLQMRMKRSVRNACADMERVLKDYPPGLYSNSARGHKSGLLYADSCVMMVRSILHSEHAIITFDSFYYNKIEGLLSESLETLMIIRDEAAENAPCYLRKGGPQPQRLKPLPVAKKSP